MNILPDELILFIFELRGGLQHRTLFKNVLHEMNRNFLWISSLVGYQEILIPDKDFITELLICNKNNLKISPRI
tara:strand:+ start:65 stop:286 length:222 start_codon:yes stop_codon:yes gene_type:complete